MLKTINVAKDFSRYPAGRFTSDGPFSGEQFRNEILIPALKSGAHIIVELDGTRGYGSSFLEEAFGGLIRAGFTRKEIGSKIAYSSSDESLPVEILSYLDDAANSHGR